MHVSRECQENRSSCLVIENATLRGITDARMIPTEGCCLPRVVKLNRGGRSLPLGSLVSGLRISSKKGWTIASMGKNRLEGVYAKRWAIKSSASGGVLERKI